MPLKVARSGRIAHQRVEGSDSWISRRGLKKHRLLFVAHSGNQGGAEYCLDTFLANLNPEKYDATVFFPWDGPMADAARLRGCAVAIWPCSWWMGWQYSPWYFKYLLASWARIALLARYLKRKRIDLVYTNSAVIFEPALAARLAGVPHIWHVHEVLKKGNVANAVLPLGIIKRIMARCADRIIFESHASRHAYDATNESDQTTVVYNCVRFPENSNAEDRESARGRLGIGAADHVAGFIGQFSERKNPLAFVRAIAKIPDRARTRFLLVGEGPLHQELSAAIAGNGLQDCCQILPFQTDVRWIFEAIDVLVLPSLQESFGLVLVEAAAFGKPAIATRTEGPTEIIVDGATGLLVSPDNDTELAEALVKIFGNEVDRAAMGRAAAQRAKELFSAAEHARRVEAIIDDVLQLAGR